LCDGPDLCLAADSGLEDSRSVKSSAGDPAVSLNSCSVAATLRPIPAFTGVLGDMLLSLLDDEEEEDEEEHDGWRNSGREFCGGDLNCVQSVEVRGVGIVRALVLLSERGHWGLSILSWCCYGLVRVRSIFPPLLGPRFSRLGIRTTEDGRWCEVLTDDW